MFQFQNSVSMIVLTSILAGLTLKHIFAKLKKLVRLNIKSNSQFAKNSNTHFFLQESSPQENSTRQTKNLRTFSTRSKMLKICKRFLNHDHISLDASDDLEILPVQWYMCTYIFTKISFGYTG